MVHDDVRICDQQGLQVLERNPGYLGRELDLGGRRQPESQVFQGMGYVWKELGSRVEIELG